MKRPSNQWSAASALILTLIGAGLLDTLSGPVKRSSTRTTSSEELDRLKMAMPNGAAFTARPAFTSRAMPIADKVATAGADAVSSPDPTIESFLGIVLVAIWLVTLRYITHVRRKSEILSQVDVDDSDERTETIQDAPRDVARDSRTYQMVKDRYNRLRDGTASTTDVDELRETARSLLMGHNDMAQGQRLQVKGLLEWLDYARTQGCITITVQQLRERKMGSWDIEFGIDAGTRSIKGKKTVKGNSDINGCVVKLPWDPSGTIKLWMHLADIGYETCWGHFGPIAMTSAEVLQESSGLSREFHADQYDKDFKVAFKIERNFRQLPNSLSQVFKVAE